MDLQHIRLCGAGRESIQVAHAMVMNLSNLTGLDSGQNNLAGQNRAFQSFNSHGTVANSFFTTIGTATSVYCAFIKGDGYTIKNSLFAGREHFAIYTGKLDGWYAKSLLAANDPFIVDSCIIDYDRTQDGDKAFTITLDYCDIIIKNCVINSDIITGLYTDWRADGGSYDIIDGGGNQFLPSSHIAFNPTFDALDRVTSDYHYNRGMGWLTPTAGIYPSYVSVGLSGTEQSGQVLTATPSTPDAGGGSSVDGTLYQWYSADNDSGLNEIIIVSNGQSSTFTLTANEIGKFVRCLAQAVNDLDLAGDIVASSYTGAIAA